MSAEKRKSAFEPILRRGLLTQGMSFTYLNRAASAYFFKEAFRHGGATLLP